MGLTEATLEARAEFIGDKVAEGQMEIINTIFETLMKLKKEYRVNNQTAEIDALEELEDWLRAKFDL